MIDFKIHGVWERALGRAGGGRSLTGIKVQRITDDLSSRG